MKRINEMLMVGATALLLLAGIAVGATARGEPQPVPSSPAQDTLRTITVVGTGKASLVPDVAQVNVGAKARAATVSEAKAEVERMMVGISTVLLEMGIDERDIQTSHYSIHFEQEPVQAVGEVPIGESQGGYCVWNMLRVTVRDAERAGDVLDAVVRAGANQVHGVNFTVSDESSWQTRARQKAMSDAKARAAELAGPAGVELGAVQSVSEVVDAWPATMAVAPESIMSGGFSPSELELSTRIRVTFAIQ